MTRELVGSHDCSASRNDIAKIMRVLMGKIPFIQSLGCVRELVILYEEAWKGKILTQSLAFT